MQVFIIVVVVVKVMAYAQCLELNDIQNVKKNACNDQFLHLKQCFQAALKNVH